MTYPFSLILPAALNLILQGFLWSGYFFHISWLTKTALFWGGAASASAASLFLVLYRFLAFMDQNPWNKGFLICTLIQIGALVGGCWFIWAGLVG